MSDAPDAPGSADRAGAPGSTDRAGSAGGGGGADASGVCSPAGKRTLRRDLLAARARLADGDVREAAGALTRHVLDMPEVSDARTVGAYVSIGAEPGTRPLLDALRARGARVLLPVLLPDGDLDWAVYEGRHRLSRTGRGLLEPSGPPLGPEAVAAADVVLLPGLAVDRCGMRLGRGGGSYDRVLARLGAAGRRPLLVALLHSGELLDEVPAEAHDRPVDAAVTPEGVHRLPAPGAA